MVKKKNIDLASLTNEDKLIMIDEAVKEFNLKNELYEIEKAKAIIKVSRVVCSTKVKERKFNFVEYYDEVITNNDTDYGIRACKIKDIDEFIYLGWKRIRKIAEHTIKHETISLNEVTKEYGDLKNKANLNTYLIHTKLKINKINIDKKYIRVEVENGLLLRHFNRTAIQHLKKSGNKTKTLEFVQWNIYPEDVDSVINKKTLSKNDVQRLESSYLFFKELFNDNERIASVPQNVYEKLCEMAANLLKKYQQINHELKNGKINDNEIDELNAKLKNYGEVA